MDLHTEKSKNIKIGKKKLWAKIFKLEPRNKKKLMMEPNYMLGDDELLENIRSAKKEWLDANMNFEYVDDQEIIDYYTYKIMASQVRYEYFIRKAKEKGFTAEILEGGLRQTYS